MSLDNTIDDKTRTEIEAATFRRLLEHLGKHPEVQNIDLMNLAFFCRNCIAKWYSAEAGDRGLEMDYVSASTSAVHRSSCGLVRRSSAIAIA